MAAVPPIGIVYASIQLLSVGLWRSASCNLVVSKIKIVSISWISTSGTDAEKTEVLNYTSSQCSAIGEALLPTATHSLTNKTSLLPPLQVATVPHVFPTGNVQGSVPQFSNLPLCGVGLPFIDDNVLQLLTDFKQFCAMNGTAKNGGSITDLQTLCKSATVLQSIGDCESALCSPTDHLSTSSKYSLFSSMPNE